MFLSLSVSVTNHDPQYKVVQHVATPARAIEEYGDFLYEHGHQKDERNEKEALHQLTTLVMKLIAETEPLRGETEKTLRILSNRITSLEKLFADLKRELNDKTGHDLDKEFDAIKNELISLSQTAASAGETSKAKLTELHDSLKGVGFAGGHGGLSKDLIESISSGWKWSFGLSVIAVFMIIGAGAGLYHRFRTWEKKHIL